tara:strand:+ start:288 stop:449 length:162 start_codon:yes stop_codon:yes gene_type:complete
VGVTGRLELDGTHFNLAANPLSNANQVDLGSNVSKTGTHFGLNTLNLCLKTSL